jgi:hypothetical protein
LTAHNTWSRASFDVVLLQECPSMLTDNVGLSSFFGNERDEPRFGLEKRAFTGLTTRTSTSFKRIYCMLLYAYNTTKGCRVAILVEFGS